MLSLFCDHIIFHDIFVMIDKLVLMRPSDWIGGITQGLTEYNSTGTSDFMYHSSSKVCYYKITNHTAGVC